MSTRTRTRPLVLAVSLALTPHLLTAADSLAIEGVNVVPMDREAVLEGVTVLVEDGRVAALGAPEHVAIPPEAARIDARGRYLLPGLYEMHVHIRDTSVLPYYLGHGFTTVRDMDGRQGDTLAWRVDVAAGALVGPRIIAAGAMLNVDAPEDSPYQVKTAQQARTAVREMKAKGYDLIKVYRVEREPFFALMDEARKLGIPVSGHHPDVVHDKSYDAPLDLTTDEVIETGFLSFEHIAELISASLRMKLDADSIRPLAERLRAKDVAVGTLIGQNLLVDTAHREGQAFLTPEREADVRAFAGDAGVEGAKKQIDFLHDNLPEHIADMSAALPDFVLAMLRTFNEVGVVLVIGTDSHLPMVTGGRSALEEMELFVEAGLTPYDALRAATYNPAKVLGELERRGTIAVGKEADLLLVDANPLEDLATLRTPFGVLMRETFYDRAELSDFRAPKAKP